MINAGNFQRQPQIFISEDLGKNWKEISKGFFGSFIQMLVDPDNPNLVMLIGNSIRGYHFQAKDENYEWKAMRSMDWFSRKSEKFKKLDLSRGFSTRTVAYILRATLKNYYQFDFGSQTEICPFFIIPKKENYKFKSNEPKFIQTALKFMVKRNPSDNAKELEIKITDSQNKTSEFWGINMILPDGNRKFSLAKAKQNSNYEVVRVSLNHPYHRKINLDDLGDFSQKGNYQVQLLYDNISLEPTEKDIWLGNFIGEVFTVTIY
ncbi:MAG: hypothetical protein K1X72_18565 [Pyrinomonadaceae bacterium]|nr:hypothetical protein [Pyrinomonadaceae bacterium]